MSSPREEIEETIAVCRTVIEYFSSHAPSDANEKGINAQAEQVIRNLEPILSRLFLKTKSAQITTHPCQENAQRIAGLLAEVSEKDTPFSQITVDLEEEFQSLERNSEVVKAAAASRDTIIT